MRSARSITLLFLALLLAVAGVTQYPRQFREYQKSAALTALLASAGEIQGLVERTKTYDCRFAGENGALPDPDCSPGAVFASTTPEQFCVPGYTKTVRDVPVSLKKKVYAEYGISYPQPSGSYEVDHIIPLAIGGSNNIANLYPEAADPKPGFKEKDVVEVYLQEEICAGRADMRAAQAQIAHDWLSIYKAISPTDIARIRAKYRSWSN